MWIKASVTRRCLFPNQHLLWKPRYVHVYIIDPLHEHDHFRITQIRRHAGTRKKPHWRATSINYELLYVAAALDAVYAAPVIRFWLSNEYMYVSENLVLFNILGGTKDLCRTFSMKQLWTPSVRFAVGKTAWSSKHGRKIPYTKWLVINDVTSRLTCNGSIVLV